MPREVGGLTEGARTGTFKCVFVYNTSKNVLRGNRFEDCEIGVHFTAGSERNSISGNAFINNRTQVKYVGTRALDWSEKGRGNYWSDNPAFDLNGDGIADEAYRPNDMVDRVMWAFPGGQAADQQPRNPGDPLGAVPVPGAASRRRDGQRAADGAARIRQTRTERKAQP